MSDIQERLRNRAITRHTISHDAEGAQKACRVMEADRVTMNAAADIIDRLVEALENMLEGQNPPGTVLQRHYAREALKAVKGDKG